jgi:NADH:ubiquinone oxidoreductase subunit 4 (subunit M)
MYNLLSLVTFLPMIGAIVLVLFLRGEDAMAQKNAKLLALFTTSATFVLSLFVLAGSIRRTPISSSSRTRRGWAGCATRWAWTASRCCS